MMLMSNCDINMSIIYGKMIGDTCKDMSNH